MLTAAGAAFCASFVCGICFYFAMSLVPEKWHEAALLASGVALLVLLVAASIIQPIWAKVVGWAAGLTWGFLVSVSIAVSIQNARVSVWWPTFLPALIVVPAAMCLVAAPFVLARRWLAARRAQRPALAPAA